MKSLRLYKKEKLCGLTTIEALFSPSNDNRGENNRIMAWPWRVIWHKNSTRDGLCTRFLISVPKKRIRRAVDRVTMRRRCREAYRLNRHLFNAETSGIDMIFIYVANEPTDYSTTEASVKKILCRINSSGNNA